MTRKQRRLTMIGGSLAVLAIAAALVLNAMRDSIVFFSTPTMAAEKQIPAGKRFRLGGLVEPGSLVRGDNLAVNFSVAALLYRFREGDANMRSVWLCTRNDVIANSPPRFCDRRRRTSSMIRPLITRAAYPMNRARSTKATPCFSEIDR